MANVHKQRVLVFEQGGDSVLRYQGWLCVLMVDGLQHMIMEKAHSSRYSIHPGSTKMYLDFGRNILVGRYEKGHCQICRQVLELSTN